MAESGAGGPLQRGEFGCRQVAQAARERRKQRAKNLRPLALKRCPQFAFRLAFVLRYRLKRYEDGAVGKVRPRDDVLDPIQDDWPHRREQHFVIIGLELAHCEATASRQAAERVGEPRG